MRALFLDTAGWFAALSPREAGHELARGTFEEAVDQEIRLVTTSFVVAEMHALILRSLDLPAGRRFLDHVLESGEYLVADTGSDVVSSAVKRWIARYTDQRFSLCDAVSFEVMRRERITHAITFDRHFRVAGFGILGT